MTLITISEWIPFGLPSYTCECKQVYLRKWILHRYPSKTQDTLASANFSKSIWNAKPFLLDLSLLLVQYSRFDRLSSIVEFDFFFLLPSRPLPREARLANNFLNVL